MGQPAAMDAGQIELYEESPHVPRTTQPRPARAGRVRPGARLCAGCRAKEARYGFQPDECADPSAGRGAGRLNTLCFECFRMEIDRRHRVAAQLARGWNAEQASLPLADTLKDIDLRRRRAQIAARHALGA
jgi:hypothetical protein